MSVAGHLVLLNQSPALVSEDQAVLMARFTNAHLKRLAAAWGTLPWTCSYAASLASAPPVDEAARLYLLKSPDVANAGGYHDVDPTGHPYARVFLEPTLDNGGVVIASSVHNENANTVLCTVGHEACETALDAYVGSWELMPDGKTLVAREACDACEDRAKLIKLADGHSAWCSDFVTPAWFSRRNAPGPYTWADTLTAPFSMTPGGYLIEWSTKGPERDVFPAELHAKRDHDTSGRRITWGPAVPTWKKEVKLQATSRTAKLLARG